MRLLAEHVLEARHVPFVGHAAFRLDADDPAQALIAAQLGEHGLGGDVPQGDPQHDDPPEHVHRVIVAPLAPGDAERVEQLAVGECGEQILDGLQRGTVFQAVPGEEWLGGVDDHRRRRTSGWNEEKGGHTHYYATNPRAVGVDGGKIVKKRLLGCEMQGKPATFGGTCSEARPRLANCEALAHTATASLWIRSA